MSITYLFWGILIGVIVAAPMGPVNIICIRRSLSMGPMRAWIAGLGAAVADTIFGGIAAVGMTSVTTLIEKHYVTFELVGGTIMIVVAINIWFKHPHMTDVKQRFGDPAKAFLGAFILTMTNPMTVLGFIALFAGLGLGDLGDNLINAALITGGVFIGSAGWFLALSEFIGLVKKKVSDDYLVLINRVSAAIILGFGGWAVGHNVI